MNLALPLFVLCALSAAPPSPAPTAEQAKVFIQATNAELRRLTVRASTAAWLAATYITDDSERNSASMNEDLMAATTAASKASLKFAGVKGLDADTARQLLLLRYPATQPSPNDGAKRSELATIAAKLEGLYGKGKFCSNLNGKETCRDLQQLSAVLARAGSKNGPTPQQQLTAWHEWHETTKEMRALYPRYVELLNLGAKELETNDFGELWRSQYEMSPAAFEQETERLWQQMKPLYDDLHCYVRRRLSEKYGPSVVDPKAPIPAHLLGNMWAQDWANIYPLVEPYQGQPSLDFSKSLAAQKLDAQGVVRIGEDFFTSMGFEPLPKTFWERSQFVKPPGREVVCHASAWDVTSSNDLRIKMCITPSSEEDFQTIHHELGHDYYYNSYFKLPILYQQGAHEGFHEAVGDALGLSITPAYLKQKRLIAALPNSDKGIVNTQMRTALDKIAFVPFGRLIDQWRWDVAAGRIKPEQYNEHWWALRRKFQGVEPGEARAETNFDPGAKYHVAANVSYTRYLLARVLQYQFYKAMCVAAHHQGPLHTCSTYGSTEAGAKLKAMLALGASKPWPDALEALTGQRQMDASAMLEYFAPLQTWLKQQNQGQKCGW